MILRALSIGRLAREALRKRWPASVVGVTSGGIFLRVAEKRIVFLTYSPFRGPNTINLAPSSLDLQQFEQDQLVLLNLPGISIPGTLHAVSLIGVSLWKPEKPPSNLTVDWAQVAIRLRRIALAAFQAKGDDGFSPALPALVGAGPFTTAGDLTPPILTAIAQAAKLCSQGNFTAAVKTGYRWVGYGRGLTPSGDDCLAGMLLALRRWGNELHPDLDIRPINRSAVQYTRHHTTLLSATINHAATLGEADERILAVLDGIMTGNFDEDLAVERLVKMGHSSGVDTLVGITLVLASIVLTISDRI